MEVITDILQFSKSPNGCVMTIGVFDGVHRGHREIIGRAIQSAKSGGYELVVLSFNPGPREFFKGTDEDFYLLTLEEFISELGKLGVDRLLLIPFDRALRETRAGDFLNDVLRDRLDARVLVVGHDFAFGAGREGSIEFVKRHSADIGLELVVVDEFTVDGSPVRATTIREMIRAGKIEQANKYLGYEFHVSGEVIPGNGVGKSIGYPTANITWPKSKVKPLRGVYAVMTELDGHEYPAVANFGVRPTFKDATSSELFEIHLIEHDPGDLEGKKIKSRFVAFIREEKEFPSPGELAARIADDMLKAKEILQIKEKERR